MSGVKYLLDNGADVNTANSKGFTLLMHCVKINDFDLVNTVLSYHPKINLKDITGVTALYFAVKNNNLEMVRLLVQNGATITDEAYMLALESKYKQIVQYFDLQDKNKTIFLEQKAI